jgi:hypothetical protein
MVAGCQLGVPRIVHTIQNQLVTNLEGKPQTKTNRLGLHTSFRNVRLCTTTIQLSYMYKTKPRPSD